MPLNLSCRISRRKGLALNQTIPTLRTAAITSVVAQVSSQLAIPELTALVLTDRHLSVDPFIDRVTPLPEEPSSFEPIELDILPADEDPGFNNHTNSSDIDERYVGDH